MHTVERRRRCPLSMAPQDGGPRPDFPSTMRAVGLVAILLLGSLAAPARQAGAVCTLSYMEDSPLMLPFPHYNTTSADRRVWDLLYEPLVRVNLDGAYYSLVLDFPHAAVSPDSTRWSVPLLPTPWQSGRGVSATDIAKTYDALKQLSDLGDVDWIRELYLFSHMAIAAANDTTITISYTGKATLESVQESLECFYVIPWTENPNLESLYGGRLDEYVTHDTGLTRRQVGNGRWKPCKNGLILRSGVDMGLKSDELCLDVFPRFPGGASEITHVRATVQPSAIERENAFLHSEEYNLMLTIPFGRAHVEKFRSAGVDVAPRAQRSFTSIVISKRNDALRHEPLVREALIYAVNRPQIIESQYGSEYAEVLETPYPRWYENHYPSDSLRIRPYDPGMARSLLTKAGFTRMSPKGYGWRKGFLEFGSDAKPLLFLLRTDFGASEEQFAVNSIRATWDSLGIKIETKSVDPQTVPGRLAAGTWDFYLETSEMFGAWSLMRVLSDSLAGRPQNEPFICSPRVKELLQEYETVLLNRNRRIRVGQALDRAIYEACDRIYLWSVKPQFACRRNIAFVRSGWALFENPAPWGCSR